MRPRDVLISAAAVLSVAAPVQGADRHAFSIPPGPLANVLRAIADQTGAALGYDSALVGARSSPGVSGAKSTAAAFEAALRGTGLRAVSVGAGRFQIRASEVTPPAAPPPPRRPIVTKAPPTMATGNDIVVTGTKRGLTVARLPGAVVVVPMDGGAADGTPRDSAELADRQPILQSTAFGRGRDKLFVRGIADSSFAGPTQATVGNYLGDSRLLYAGSDPAIRLIDMKQVEILEGPQGTLYGAGAIGGIIRLVPEAPDMAKRGGSVDASLGFTEHGEASEQIAAALNLPVASDVAAVRLVGYHAHDGGYVDDPVLGRDAINGSDVDGGRLAIRIVPADDWTIDIDGLGQSIRTGGPQYALRGNNGLIEQSSLDQPYRDWIAMGSATVRHTTSGGINLLATVGGVQRDTHLRYDATRIGAGPQPLSAYDERNASTLIDGELRIWRVLPSGSSWLVGVAADSNGSADRRQLGPPTAQRDITGVDNRSLDLAAYGEGTLKLGRRLELTAGGRVTHARIDGQAISARPVSPFAHGIAHTRFDPTAGFSYALSGKVAWYGRFAQGFRAGGLAVAANVGRIASYRPDTISVAETGLRASRLFGGRVSGVIGVSQAWWHDIQADLVGRNGIPFTANIGDGRITTVETRLTVEATSRLRLEADGLFAHSKLINPAPGYERDGGNALPDTPKASLFATLTWLPPIDASRRFSVAATLRRQGHSELGAGTLFGFDQRGYTEAGLLAALTRGRRRYSLRIDNLSNAKGDRFALGNPFQLRDRDQYTPLRPRTLTLSVAQGF